MLYAPALYSLRTNSLVRTNDAINGMTSEQLRTGILQRCVSGRLTASYVALFDFTMQQPFRHFCSLSWGTHDTQHSAPARWLHPWIFESTLRIPTTSRVLPPRKSIARARGASRLDKKIN